MTIGISQFSDDGSGLLTVFDIKFDCCYPLFICVHADPPVHLFCPRFCPHPHLVVSAEPQMVFQLNTNNSELFKA